MHLRINGICVKFNLRQPTKFGGSVIGQRFQKQEVSEIIKTTH